MVLIGLSAVLLCTTAKVCSVAPTATRLKVATRREKGGKGGLGNIPSIFTKLSACERKYPETFTELSVCHRKCPEIYTKYIIIKYSVLIQENIRNK